MDRFLTMLNVSDLLNSSCSEPTELSIIQSTVRILLACLDNTDPDVSIPAAAMVASIRHCLSSLQYYVVASTRLYTVVQSQCLPLHDIYFTLYHLALTLENAIIEGGK